MEPLSPWPVAELPWSSTNRRPGAVVLRSDVRLGMPMELLHEGIESSQRRVDWGDRLLSSVDHLSADDVGELFPSAK